VTLQGGRKKTIPTLVLSRSGAWKNSLLRDASIGYNLSLVAINVIRATTSTPGNDGKCTELIDARKPSTAACGPSRPWTVDGGPWTRQCSFHFLPVKLLLVVRQPDSSHTVANEICDGPRLRHKPVDAQ
jgi:hypothetical protein